MNEKRDLKRESEGGDKHDIRKHPTCQNQYIITAFVRNFVPC